MGLFYDSPAVLEVTKATPGEFRRLDSVRKNSGAPCTPGTYFSPLRYLLVPSIRIMGVPRFNFDSAL